MRFVSAFFLLALLAISPARAAPPVVVELFTSQGCSSCPPADAYLAELAKRPDVIALGWHVAYWDRLGWADPHANPMALARQRLYREALGFRSLYTPQMIVQGAHDLVGNDRTMIEAVIADEARIPSAAIQARWEPDGALRIELEPAAGQQPPKDAAIRLIGYGKARTSAVQGGENDGKRLTAVNPVVSVEEVGRWTGDRRQFRLEPARTGTTEGYALLVQEGTAGRIVGAARVNLSAP